MMLKVIHSARWAEAFTSADTDGGTSLMGLYILLLTLLIVTRQHHPIKEPKTLVIDWLITKCIFPYHLASLGPGWRLSGQLWGEGHDPCLVLDHVGGEECMSDLRTRAVHWLIPSEGSLGRATILLLPVVHYWLPPCAVFLLPMYFSEVDSDSFVISILSKICPQVGGWPSPYWACLGKPTS